MSRTYHRITNRHGVPSVPATPSPWVRATGHRADVDVHILSDRTDDGGSITRLVDQWGKRLHDDPIVGRPGHEDEVARAIAETITELLRRK